MSKLKNLSADDLRSLVEEALRTEMWGENASGEVAWNLWVWTVYPFADSLIYCFEDAYFSRSYSIDEATLAVTLTDDKTEVERETIWKPVEMSVSFSEAESDFVEWSGTIFEAGDYPDKGCSFTEDDLIKIEENFVPVPLKIEHMDTVLDEALKKFGLISVKADGAILSGTIRVPKWLDIGLKDIARKVSVGFDHTLRKFKEISLVKFPRVANAQVFVEELLALQLQFSSAPAKDPEPPAKSPTQPPEFSGNSHRNMNLKEKLLALLKVQTPENLATFGISESDFSTIEFTEKTPEMPAQFKAILNGSITQAAEGFANAIVQEGKATKAQQPHIEQMFRTALTADGKDGSVQFAEDTGKPVEGANTKALRDFFAELKPILQFGSVIRHDVGNGETQNAAGMDFSSESVRAAAGLPPKAVK